jgi:hypothetical protein
MYLHLEPLAPLARTAVVREYVKRRETEEKARQPETKLDAIANTRDKAKPTRCKGNPDQKGLAQPLTGQGHV